jgi:HD superfamily phosphohydrolase
MKTQRLRDPLHDLIVFDKDNVIDQIAWALINAREFQRLRRIRRLGFSEIVYPGATHTRFAHSVGVYYTARLLLAIAKRQLGANFDNPQQQITLLAALLHDLGHGPFSHAFEEVQKARRLHKKHEEWTIEISLRQSAKFMQFWLKRADPWVSKICPRGWLTSSARKPHATFTTPLSQANSMQIDWTTFVETV